MLLAMLAGLSAVIVAGMVRVGAIDHPVARSSHSTPTPKGGGVGIALAFLAGMMLAGTRADLPLTAAALCLAGASYLDDVFDLPFWTKLAAQAFAALAVVLAGLAPVSVAVPGLGHLPLGPSAPLLALAWLLFTTNAVNFIDGLNGLAAGSVAVVCTVFACVAGLPAAWPEALLAACIAGFLPFNYPAARIFMGDVGSQFLGFVVAALALRHAGDPRLVAILPLGLAPILLDVAVTLVRRIGRGERLTVAHRGHLYQIAHRTQVPAWQVAAAYGAMAINGAVCGAAVGINGSLIWAAAAIAPFCVWALLVLKRERRHGL